MRTRVRVDDVSSKRLRREAQSRQIPSQARMRLEHRLDRFAAPKFLENQIDRDARPSDDRLPIITFGSEAISGSAIINLLNFTLANGVRSPTRSERSR